MSRKGKKEKRPCIEKLREQGFDVTTADGGMIFWVKRISVAAEARIKAAVEAEEYHGNYGIYIK